MFIAKLISIYIPLLSGVSAFSDSLPYSEACIPGAAQTEKYMEWLRGKRIALVANQTSRIEEVHIVDSLLKRSVHVIKVFAPEHGFRGVEDAGATIHSGVDSKTGLPLISLYGSKKKPSQEDLGDVDLVIFDIQDVGARFYTYISTLHYIMESCAENNKELLILDRPNPNGFYVDGPVLEEKFKSFVGMHPVPVVHGLTTAEYALMINGEKWLKNGLQCQLKYVKVENHTHNDLCEVKVRPSPNLRDMEAIYLYPSLCFFEGTLVSVGRGTEHPFKCIGYPGNIFGTFTFQPQSLPGASNPPYLGKVCQGMDLRGESEQLIKKRNLNLTYLMQMFSCYNMGAKDKFFNDFFDKLAGTDSLRKMLMAGKSEEEIRASWKKDLELYKRKRKKYLLYPDFE